MADVAIKMSCKRLFFDRAAVTTAIDAKTLKALRTAGGLTRKVARRSIRKRKKASQPGRPPSSHTGRLRDFLWFALGADEQSVVVGPVKLNQVDLSNGSWQRGVVPEVLEYGGRIGVLEQQYRPGGEWTRVDKRRRQNDNPKRIRVATIAPRPYMAPALAEVQPKLPALWAGSIRP